LSPTTSSFIPGFPRSCAALQKRRRRRSLCARQG
jgi:hypothetical protein